MGNKIKCCPEVLPLPSVSCKWKKGSNFLSKEGLKSQSEARLHQALSCILKPTLRFPLRNELPYTKVSSRTFPRGNQENPQRWDNIYIYSTIN